MLGFAFPHSTGLFTPVAAALAASALRLGPHGLPALPRNAKSPQPPKCRGARFCERDISRYVAQSRNAALQTTDRAAPVVHTSDCQRPDAPQMDGRYQEISVIRKVGFASSGCGTGELRFMPVNIG